MNSNVLDFAESPNASPITVNLRARKEVNGNGHT